MSSILAWTAEDVRTAFDGFVEVKALAPAARARKATAVFMVSNEALYRETVMKRNALFAAAAMFIVWSWQGIPFIQLVHRFS
jgi:hypothetical protein